jgi:hypothetical protein
MGGIWRRDRRIKDACPFFPDSRLDYRGNYHIVAEMKPNDLSINFVSGIVATLVAFYIIFKPSAYFPLWVGVALLVGGAGQASCGVLIMKNRIKNRRH